MTEIAEELGYHAVTIGHHHFQMGYPSDPLTLMAAVAARTERIRVGTGIFQLGMHHPVRVAEQVATIDEISGGRITLGVGGGWNPVEYTAFGHDIADRGALMEEALQVMRTVWTEERCSWQGRFYSFPEVTVLPRPVQRPHPPIHVAGSAPATVDRAARLGDGWLCSPTEPFDQAVAFSQQYVARRAELGLEPEWVLRRYAWLAPDRASIRDTVLPEYVDGLIGHWRESPERQSATKDLLDRLDAGEQVTATEIADDRLLWGSPDDVIGQIRRYQEATGCDHVHVAFGMGLPSETQYSYMGTFDSIREMARIFADEVFPAFPEADQGSPP